MPYRNQGGGGGGGLHYRDPVDEFADATERSTYFTAMATNTEYEDFVRDRSLAIVIGTIAAPTDFQTYTGEVGTYDDTLWASRRDAVQGQPGDRGAQARFTISQWMLATTIPSVVPTGGEYNVGTGALTASTGWSTAKLTPGATQVLVRSDAPINPIIQTGAVTPVWSLPFEDIDEAIADRVEEAQTAAETAQTAAETARTAAETAETNAETAETNAETAETGAEAAQTAAESARDAAALSLESSGAALAFNDLWSGDIDITTANQWKALGTEAVPSNATWLLWNGGKLSDDTNDGPSGQWTWINAATWRALTADTADTTPDDGTGMLIVEWASPDIGDGTPGFDRRDLVIGRTSSNIPLITSTNTGEDFYGASLKYITQAVSTPGGGGGASSFSDLSGSIADSQVPSSFTRDTELASLVDDVTISGTTLTLTLQDGSTVDRTLPSGGAAAFSDLTGEIADAQVPASFTRDTELGSYAELAGSTFTGALILHGTPTVDNEAATKAYVDGRTNTPTHTSDQYVAVKATSTFDADDFTGANGVAFDDGSSTATVPDTLSGSVYVGLARLMSDPDAVYLDIGQAGFNQIGGSTLQTDTVEISSSTYEVRVTNNAAEYGGSIVEYR